MELQAQQAFLGSEHRIEMEAVKYECNRKNHYRNSQKPIDLYKNSKGSACNEDFVAIMKINDEFD